MSTAFLFPGQGSQHVGMGQECYEHSPAARAVFDQADQQLGFSLSDLCFSGPEGELTDTVNQQPALYVTSYALWQMLAERGWQRPSFVAGHSLGEFSALAAAGSLSFADGLSLVRQRGELMKLAGEHEPGGMAAILALDTETIRTICAEVSATTGQRIQLANDNCPGQVVISGDSGALEEAMTRAKEAGARKVVALPITIAAHSPLMASASAEFARAVAATPIQSPQIPIIGNVSARPLTSVAEIQAEMTAQLTAPVAWTDSMRYLVQEGVTEVVEVGPGEVLLGLMKRINRKVARTKLQIEEELS